LLHLTWLFGYFCLTLTYWKQNSGQHFVGNSVDSRITGAPLRDLGKGFEQAGVVSQLEI
jgi:hypothetical protein